MAEKKKSTRAGERKSTRKKQVKPSKAKESVKKVVEEEEEGLVGLSLDITWVAIITLVAFFVGFLVRGFFTPTTTTSTSPGGDVNQGITAPPIPEGVTTLPPGHPPIPGMGAPSATEETTEKKTEKKTTEKK